MVTFFAGSFEDEEPIEFVAVKDPLDLESDGSEDELMTLESQDEVSNAEQNTQTKLSFAPLGARPRTTIWGRPPRRNCCEMEVVYSKRHYKRGKTKHSNKTPVT